MRVALVANTTWNIYNFRLNVIDMLLNAGHEVVVIAPVDHYISYKEKFKTVTHIPLHTLKRKSLNLFNDIAFALELKRVYAQVQPDMILHYTVKPNIYGGWAAKKNGIKSFAFVTGLGYAFLHNGIVEKITKRLYRWSNQFHEKVIFENVDDRLFFTDLGLMAKDQGVSIKGCGVNTGFFKPLKRAGDSEKFIFTFLGRLIYDKGIKEFVDAAKIIKKKYKHTEFWIIGDIDKDNPAAIKEKDLVVWVKERTVRYLGPKFNVKRSIADSDCIVLPSYREAIARSITEGMSMGKPVIATDTAGCREAIDENKNGFLVPVKDAVALSAAMEKMLLLSEEERTQMGNYGRLKAISEFDDKIIANSIKEIIFGV